MLSTTIAFTAVVEEDCVSVETKKIKWGLNVLPGYALYQITINNNSAYPIEVDSAIVDNLVLSYHDAIGKLWSRYMKMGFLASGTIGFSLVPAMIRFGKILDVREVLLRVGYSSLIAAGGIYLWGLALSHMYNFDTFKRHILHEKFTVKRQASANKFAWLKNLKDQVKINFDAIKVLK